MYSKIILTAITTLILIAMGSLAGVTQVRDSTPDNSEQLQLPETARTILLHEMTTITRLMGDLLEFIVQGDTRHSSYIARDIRDTNFRRESNSSQQKEIMKVAPKGFIEMYRSFHSTANELVQAVDTSDFKTAIKLYTEMAQGCLNCHATYAKQRFPNLASE